MFKRYISLGLRNLVKQKLYSSINIIGLTIGMLSFVLIMLYVNHERSFDGFSKKQKRIYRLSSSTVEQGRAIVPYVWGESLKNEIIEIENLVSFQNITIALTIKKGDEVYAQNGVIGADSTFFEIFDYPVIKGNKDKFLNHPNKIVITPETALKYFKGEDPIGQTLQINLWGTFVDYEVEGIVLCPDNSHIQFDFLIPIHLVKKHFFSPTAFESWTTHFAYTYLLMTEGFDEAKVSQDFKDFLFRHGGDELSAKITIGIEPLDDIYLKSSLAFDFPPRGNGDHINILILVAVGILLMAVINFINLTSAQSLRRVKEVGLKKILGSGRGSLVLQFVSESIISSFFSLLLSTIILMLILPFFNDFTGKSFTLLTLFNSKNVLTLLVFTFLVGLVSGIYPALVLSSFKPISILSSRSAGNSTSSLARKILVTTQFVLAVILLIATGVIYQQVSYMQQKNLGFSQDQVIVMENAREIASNTDRTQLLRAELTKLNEIRTVSASSSFPGQQSWSSGYIPEGYDKEESVSLSTIYADHDFINTYNIKMANGRNYDRMLYSDSSAYLINEAAAELFSLKDPSWGINPLKKRLNSSWGGEEGDVIGVFKNFHFESLKEEINPLVIQIRPQNFFALQIKLNTKELPQTLDKIEATWKRLFPELPYNYTFIDQEFAVHFEADRKLGKLMKWFSALSILVAILGLFGLASSLAFEKAKEVSIRKVIGASEKELVFLLSWLFLRLILIANILAIPISYFLMDSWLAKFAYSINMPTHIYLLSIGITTLVTILTVGYHAIKTATTNPVKVLYQE